MVLMPWYRRMDLLPLSLSFLIHARVDVAVFVVPIAFITPFFTPCGQPHPSSCLPHVSSHLPWSSRHPLQPAFAMVGWHTFFGISRPMFLDQKIIQQKYVSATCLSLQRSYYFLAFLLSFVFCYACCFHGKVGFIVVHLPTAALNVGPLLFELLLVMIAFLKKKRRFKHSRCSHRFTQRINLSVQSSWMSIKRDRSVAGETRTTQ